MENRTCKVCELVKPLDEFANAGTVKGVKYYRHLCIPCYSKAKHKAKYKRHAWFREYKKTLKCNRCDNDDYRVLDFHHIRDKSFVIGNAIRKSYGKKKIMSEIAKCEVVCANCHRIIHYEERDVAQTG